MKASAFMAALAGLGLALGIAAYIGLGDVAGELATAGWGLAAVTLFHAGPMLFLAGAWRAVLPDRWQAPMPVFLWARLLREAVNNLLPVAQIGGGLVAMRTLTLRGTPPPVAGASMVVDLTLEVVSQFAFSIIGLVCLMAEVGDASTATTVTVGIAVMAVAFAGFVLAQRWGILRGVEALLGWASDRWKWDALGAFANLHEETLALYRRRGGIASGFLQHLACWLLGSGEVWLALHFLGHDVSLGSAVAIESLGQAVRSAAFLIPGAIGVQEGGLILLGGLFGLSPATCLALSLVKRVRELALGVPTLAVLQVIEGRRMLQLRRRGTVARQDPAE